MAETGCNVGRCCQFWNGSVRFVAEFGHFGTVAFDGLVPSGGDLQKIVLDWTVQVRRQQRFLVLRVTVVVVADAYFDVNCGAKP